MAIREVTDLKTLGPEHMADENLLAYAGKLNPTLGTDETCREFLEYMSKVKPENVIQLDMSSLSENLRMLEEISSIVEESLDYTDDSDKYNSNEQHYAHDVLGRMDFVDNSIDCLRIMSIYNADGLLNADGLKCSVENNGFNVLDLIV